MRRIVHVFVATTLAAGAVVALALPAHAQATTGDLAAFCAARIEANSADTKAENVTVLTKMVASAPAVVSTPMADLLALVKKQGDKAFESKEGTALLATLEPYIYACFFPEGGKKNGKPHYKLGMEGSFTVS